MNELKDEVRDGDASHREVNSVPERRDMGCDDADHVSVVVLKSRRDREGLRIGGGRLQVHVEVRAYVCPI